MSELDKLVNSSKSNESAEKAKKDQRYMGSDKDYLMEDLY